MNDENKKLSAEQHLVARAQGGDFEAFAGLIAGHKDRLYRLALKMSGSEQDAEDIVQDTLLKAIDKIDQFRGEAAFGTWLYSIALNQARAVLADQKKTDLKPVEEYLPGGGHSPDNAEASRALFDWKDPHDLLEQAQLRELINRGVAALPVEYREAFLLRYIEELPIKEVAKLIGESVAATKSRVLRARLALRKYLSDAFEATHDQKVR